MLNYHLFLCHISHFAHISINLARSQGSIVINDETFTSMKQMSDWLSASAESLSNVANVDGLEYCSGLM